MDVSQLSENSILEGEQSETEVEGKTYYYTNFDLFDDSDNASKFAFLQYQLFKKKLLAYLGDDWKQYANLTVYSEKNTMKIYVDRITVFNTALEVWLELRKNLNLSQDLIYLPNSHEFISIETKFEESLVFEAFLSKFKEKFKTFKINPNTFKAVMQAFFVSAIKVWKDVITWHVSGKAYGDMKVESPSPMSMETLSNSSSKSEKNQSKLFKPLLVAREKILGIFVTKKSKTNDHGCEPITIEEEEVKMDMDNPMDFKERKNFDNFHSTVKLETPEEMKVELQNMSKTDMSQIINGENGSLNGLNKKRPVSDKNNTYIEVKKFSPREENFFSQNMLKSMKTYIEKVVQNTHTRWQVARGLVTTMIEVNKNLLNQIGTEAANLKNNMKIRILTPAHEFYNQLMDTWLIFKSNSLNQEIPFKDFLEKVKKSMGNSWNENLKIPTQLFFTTLYNEWNKIKEEDLNEENYDERVRIFVRRVRGNMLMIWEQNIEKKAQELDKKVIQQE